MTKCSLVRPKLVKSVHYAESTGNFMTRYFVVYDLTLKECIAAVACPQTSLIICAPLLAHSVCNHG